MKKFILRLDLHDNKEKRKALKTVSALSGIDSIAMNMKDKTLIVVGTVDPINVVSKLRKFWPTDIILVGPAKEPEKKDETKKEDGKKDETKKEEGKTEEAKKEDGKKEEGQKQQQEDPKKKEGGGKEEEKKKVLPPQVIPGMFMPPYRPQYYPPINTYYNQQQYHPYQPHYQQYQPANYQRHHSIEENPNACVIS